MTKLAIVKAVICEDVRVEWNSKYFLIGVYTNNTIGIEHVPMDVKMSCYFEIQTLERGSFKGEYRIIDSGGDPVIRDKISFKVNDNFVSLFFNPFSFSCTKQQIFTLQWNIEGRGWEDITPITIFVGGNVKN